MWQYRREVKYSPLCKHVKRLKMLKSLCPAVALVLPLFSLSPRSVLPSRLRRFILTTACCRARPTQKRLPSIATLPLRPTIKCCACHIIAELMLSPPHLLSVVTLVLPLCVVSLNFCSAAEPVLPPSYRRACTSLRHVLLCRVYFLSPRSAVALALSPLHLP